MVKFSIHTFCAPFLYLHPKLSKIVFLQNSHHEDSRTSFMFLRVNLKVGELVLNWFLGMFMKWAGFPLIF